MWLLGKAWSPSRCSCKMYDHQRGIPFTKSEIEAKTKFKLVGVWRFTGSTWNKNSTVCTYIANTLNYIYIIYLTGETLGLHSEYIYIFFYRCEFSWSSVTWLIFKMSQLMEMTPIPADWTLYCRFIL